MFVNLVLGACSSALLAIAGYAIHRRRRSLSLVEVYFMMVAVYFGLWGIIDALVQDFSDYKILPIILVYITIISTLYMSWYFLRIYLPAKKTGHFLRYLELSAIANYVAKIPRYYIGLVVFTLFIFKLYSIQKFNIVNNYDWESLQDFNVVLPKWFIIIDGMLRSVLFITIFPTVIGIFRNQGKTKWYWLGIALIILLIEGMYGRSSVLNFIIIFLLYWYIEKNDAQFSYDLVLAGFAAFCLLFLYSNFYQTYRSIFIFRYGYAKNGSYVAEKLIPALKNYGNPVKNVMNSQKTINNFKERPAVWRFSYRFIDRQLDGGYRYVPYGVLLKDAVIFMIPRAFWPDKPHFLLQPEAYKLYQFDYKFADAPSIFAFAQIDFGFYSFIIIPLFLLLGFVPTAYALSLSANRPFLFAIIAGEFAYYCVDIIRDYYGLFMYYREVIFLIALYFLFNLLKPLVMKTYNLAVENVG